MNVQAETNEDEDKGLVYNHDEARVLATVITTFNEHMECTVEEQGQQYIKQKMLKVTLSRLLAVALNMHLHCTSYCLNNQCEY